MKKILHNISAGLVILLFSLTIANPTLAHTNNKNSNKDNRNDKVKISANLNLQALSQFTLVNAKLTVVSDNSLTVKLTRALPRGSGHGSYQLHQVVTVGIESGTIISRDGFGRSSLA